MPIVALELLVFLISSVGLQLRKDEIRTNSSRRLRKKNAKSREKLSLYSKESKSYAWYSLEKEGKQL